MSNTALLPKHIADFERSGLSANTIEQAGVYKENLLALPRDPLIAAPGKTVNNTDRPTIVITNEFMRDTASETIEALQLSNCNDPYIFRYGTNLIRLNRETTAITPFTVPGLRGTIDRCADFFEAKIIAGVTRLMKARPPMDVIQDILAIPDLPFPNLAGISRVPVFLPDGRLLNKSGYDAGSGLFLNLHGLHDLKSDLPITDAIILLRDEMLGDFPFSDDASRAHAICALLLPFVRHMIDGPTLLHLMEACLRGTGKGLLADILAWVCAGMASEPIVLPKSEEEVEKRIMSALMSGALMIQLDNINQLKSPALCVALTTEKYQGRILGKSEMRTIPNKALWVATGNNIELSDEIVRRTVSIRLDSNIARPEERCNFRHPNLIQWVQQSRSRIVSACLSIVQHWIDAGRPSGSATLGRFESWADVMGGILDVAGIKGFLQDRERLHSQNDQESTEWSAVIDVWYQQYGENAVTAKDVFKILKEHELLLDIWAGRSALAGQQRLGYVLPTKRDRVFKSGVTGFQGFQGFKIQAAGRDSRTGSAAYRLTIINNENYPQHRSKTPETTETMQTRINTGREGSAMNGFESGWLHKTPETPVKSKDMPDINFEMEVEL